MYDILDRTRHKRANVPWRLECASLSLHHFRVFHILGIACIHHIAMDTVAFEGFGDD